MWYTCLVKNFALLTKDEETMHTVKDGDRNLKFDGTELATSSSQAKDKYRWVEFKLYRTARGDYVLHRLGVTLYFHSAYCDVVRRNRIDPLPSEVVSVNLVPCERCNPGRSETFLYPEKPRHWAQVSATPEGVIASLKKYDEHGTEYLTGVARRLLETAAKNDADLRDAFYTEYLE